MFHLHPPSSVILVTCFVSLFEISSHLFMSLRTTSLSFSRVLQFHTMSSDKPAVLVIFENYKKYLKNTMNSLLKGSRRSNADLQLSALYLSSFCSQSFIKLYYQMLSASFSLILLKIARAKALCFMQLLQVPVHAQRTKD